MELNGLRVHVKHRNGCNTLQRCFRSGQKQSIWWRRRHSTIYGTGTSLIAARSFRFILNRLLGLTSAVGAAFPALLRQFFWPSCKVDGSIWSKATIKRQRFYGQRCGRQMHAAASIAYESKMLIRRFANVVRFQRAPLRILMGSSDIHRPGCLARRIVAASFTKAGIT